jgi:hypothetical protein
MKKQGENDPPHGSEQAAAHIAGARQILAALQEKIGKHPELGEAITKLEMALNILAVKTGGVL